MGKIGMREREAGRRIVEMRNREVGALAPRSFFHRAAASLDNVLRLGIHRKLDKHRSCVNTVSFNAAGNILVSGSDDRMVMLWDWEMGTVKLSFHSGHWENVFQAKFMPYTDDRTMVTCAADGGVRIAKLQDGGHVFTSELVKHDGRAYKIAIEPGNPHILYSCGEDGLVYHFDLRTHTAIKLFKCKRFKESWYIDPIVQLNAIAINPRNINHFAIGGSDEFARVFDIRNCWWDRIFNGGPIDCFCPPHLIDDDNVGITGLAFSHQSELLASYTYNSIYLFSKNQGLGPNPFLGIRSSAMAIDESKQTFGEYQNESIQAYIGHRNLKTMKGVGFFGPSCDYVTSGSDCGRIFIWRKKGGELVRVMDGDKRVVNCIEPSPCATMLASCGIENDIKIWIPNAKEPAGPVNVEEIMKQPICDDFDFNFEDYEYDDDDDDDDDNDDDNDGDRATVSVADSDITMSEEDENSEDGEAYDVISGDDDEKGDGDGDGDDDDDEKDDNDEDSTNCFLPSCDTE